MKRRKLRLRKEVKEKLQTALVLTLCLAGMVLGFKLLGQQSEDGYNQCVAGGNSPEYCEVLRHL